MPKLNIQIGASVNADLGAVVFGPLIKASERAAAQIKKNLDGAVAGMGGGRGGPRAGDRAGGTYRTPGGGLGPSAAAIQRAQRDMTRSLDAGERERTRIARREAAERAKIAKAEAREAAKIQNAIDQQQRRAQRIADAGALRVSGGAVRNFGGMVRQGIGVAGDLARGAGLDFSFAGALQRRMSLETNAVDLSNAGYMPGKGGAAGVRQDPRALMADAQKVAQEYAIGADSAMAGMQAFTGKTGDLETARKILGDMAKLSQATGSSMEDMVSAAGEVANALPDGPNKMVQIQRTMMAFAGQGKEGAIEIKDQAKQAAKLASRAGEFAGDPATAMGTMGALVQMARAHGGAASAPQAFTALSSFMNTFSKGARRGAMSAAGVKVKDGDKGLLDAEDIIVQALRKTGGNDLKMGKLFMDANARKVTRGFEQIYNAAGGGAKGEAAVRAEFAKYQKASMGSGEVEDSLKAKLGTRESQTTKLKNQLDKEIGDALEKAAPDLQKFASVAVEATAGLAKLAGWAASNPLKAGFIALGASVMKSIGSEIMRAVIEKGTGAMVGRVASLGATDTRGIQVGPGGQPVGKLGQALGGAMTALAITAAAVSITSAGIAMIDASYEKDRERADKGNKGEYDALSNIGYADRLRKSYSQDGPITPEHAAEVNRAEEEFESQKDAIRARIAGGEEWAGKGAGGRAAARATALTNDVLNTEIGGSGKGMNALNQQRDDAEHLAELKATLAKLEGKMPSKGEVQSVMVTNPEAFASHGGGGGGVEAGRTGIGG